MARGSSEKRIRDRLDSVADAPGADPSNIRVEWTDPDPENRPDGTRWVPPTEDEPGILQYDVWTAQRDTLDAMDAGNDIVSFQAGYGSGKTLFGTRWVIKQALEYPGSRFLVMGIDFQKARDATFRVLFEQLPGERTGVVTSSYNGPESSPIVADYNRQDHRLTLTNDTVIKLGSADRWNRYAGDSYGAIHLDEPSHYGEDLYDLLEMLGSRLRGEDGPQTMLWTLTGNGQNAAFDILERQVDADGDDLGLTVETVTASTLENPYLSDAAKERFKRQYAGTSREGQALHGGFADGGGSLLSRDQLTFVDEADLPDREYRYRLGVDLSYVSSKKRAETTDSDYTAVVLAAIDPQTNTAYLVDVGRERGLTLRESLGFVADIAQQLPDPTVVVEEVGASTWWAQEARDTVPGRIEPVTPNGSKESRLQDLGVVCEREDVVLVNREEEVDENLGYDPTWRPFVREWVQFGNDGDSPDILDAAYYAVEGLELGNYGSNGVQIFSGSYATPGRSLW
jgi:phage terminase large subunit-like protein